MSLNLSVQLRVMGQLSTELYDWGRQMRDRVNRIQGAPSSALPPLTLSRQIVSLRGIDQRLYDFARLSRNALSNRSVSPANSPSLSLDYELAAMKQISQELFEFGTQLQAAINAL